MSTWHATSVRVRWAQSTGSPAQSRERCAWALTGVNGEVSALGVAAGPQECRATEPDACFTLEIVSRDGDSGDACEVNSCACRPLDVVAGDPNALSAGQKDPIAIALEVAVDNIQVVGVLKTRRIMGVLTNSIVLDLRVVLHPCAVRPPCSLPLNLARRGCLAHPSRTRQRCSPPRG